VYDSLDRLQEFQCTVALPAPALYGQFHNLDDINVILHGLLKMGFDRVYEVSKGADLLTDLTRTELAKTPDDTLVISSACPAAVRLICSRFPKLIGNLARHLAPMEIAAIRARKEARAETGLQDKDIGIFFITPCPAKVTGIHAPGHLHKPIIDGALSMTEVYKKLLGCMGREDAEKIAQSGIMGVGWAASGGESAALLQENYLAVDGIENITAVLEDVEDGKIQHVKFLELNACNQGCVGGCLTVENPYVAKLRIRQLMKSIPISQGKRVSADLHLDEFLPDKSFENTSVLQLAENRMEAMELYKKISELTVLLPGLDCSSCGTPCCRALAEDVVLGFASEDDCIFRMRERMQDVATMGDADEYLPPPFRKGRRDHS